jgi:hypothetical protein
MDSETIQDLYLRLTGLLLKSGRPNDAWLSMERSKARTFLEMLQGRKFQEDTGRPRSAELAALEKKIIALRFELSPDNASTLRGAGREPSAIQTELHDLESRFALARQQAGLTQSRSGQALSLQPLSIAQTQKLLPPKSALLEYALLGDSVAVFVVTPNSVERKLWKTDIKALRKNVLALRAALADPSADPKALIGDVSAALIQPLSIPAGVENLIVVPTAWLAYLPFQVLEREAAP